jgi:hypothetical protein
MASMALFVITAIAVLTLVASSQSMGKRADDAYIAYNLAKNHIETLRALPFDDLSSGDETDIRLNEIGVSDENGSFLRSTDVTTPYAGDSNLALVEVSVSYEIRGAASGQPIEMVSVLYGGEGGGEDDEGDEDEDEEDD